MTSWSGIRKKNDRKSISLYLFRLRSVHDVKAVDLGANTIRFKAEIDFDGREVARSHVSKLNLDSILAVSVRVHPLSYTAPRYFYRKYKRLPL